MPFPGVGLHLGVPMVDYCNTEAVNAGLIQTIAERCPAAAFFESFMNPQRPPEEPSKTMDAGTIAHSILLEGGPSLVAVIDPNDHPAKTTGAIPEGWTNNSIRAARDEARAAGKLPILKAEFARVEVMAKRAREFIDSLKTEEPAIYAAFQPEGGDSEATLIWDDGGTFCRIRPDRINRERTLIVDYKTGDTSAEPNTWGRAQMIRMGYYVGAAFYRRGVRALFGTEVDYVYLVQEQQPPHLCSLVGVDPTAFALGAAKVDYALTLWRKCERAHYWPAYPGRVCFPELPAWEAARWEDTQASGIPYDPAKMHAKPKEKLGFDHEHDPI